MGEAPQAPPGAPLGWRPLVSCLSPKESDLPRTSLTSRTQFYSIHSNSSDADGGDSDEVDDMPPLRSNQKPSSSSSSSSSHRHSNHAGAVDGLLMPEDFDPSGLTVGQLFNVDEAGVHPVPTTPSAHDAHGACPRRTPSARNIASMVKSAMKPFLCHRH